MRRSGREENLKNTINASKNPVTDACKSSGSHAVPTQPPGEAPGRVLTTTGSGSARLRVSGMPCRCPQEPAPGSFGECLLHGILPEPQRYGRGFSFPPRWCIRKAELRTDLRPHSAGLPGDLRLFSPPMEPAQAGRGSGRPETVRRDPQRSSWQLDEAGWL